MCSRKGPAWAVAARAWGVAARAWEEVFGPWFLPLVECRRRSRSCPEALDACAGPATACAAAYPPLAAPQSEFGTMTYIF